MKLVDQVAQCRTPFVVLESATQALTPLNGAADFAKTVTLCPTRYVLGDDLTRLCTALAYSKGARTLACTDLLHVPAELVWVEWCEAPWQSELQIYGFKEPSHHPTGAGRRGALIQSRPDGRCGLIRTFWSGGTEVSVLASSMEAYFDLDTEEGEDPTAPDLQNRSSMGVSDSAGEKADILGRHFRFRYERTWADYYDRAFLEPAQREAIARHALGTIAIDIPVLMAFFLLLATRNGLPQRALTFERLNRSRAKAGKAPLLQHIEVQSPLPAAHSSLSSGGALAGRRLPRLHHVRGHLVRRGDKLYWRVPHLRGHARSGSVQTRTVTWTFDRMPALGDGPARRRIPTPGLDSSLY
jgi:hypothetical protein